MRDGPRGHRSLLFGAIALAASAACGGPARQPSTATTPAACQHPAVLVTNNTDLVVDIYEGTDLVGSVSPHMTVDVTLTGSGQVRWVHSPRPLMTADTVDVRAYNTDVRMVGHCR